MTADHVRMHRESLAEASTYVARITDADLDRPTPCAAWNLRQLLEHMIGQHDGFAAVVRDAAADAEAYAPKPFSAAAWQTSVDELVAVFAAADLTAKVVEVELHPTLALPVAVLVGAQLLDTVVHAWDIASALGLDFTPGADVADEVLNIAGPIPDDDRRERPGAPFARALPAQGSPWERSLAALGRSPAGWSGGGAGG